MENILSVAVCDDEPSAMKIISDSLTSLFAERGVTVDVEEFTDGGRLMARLPYRSFSIIFLDIEMPYDGVRLGEEIARAGANTEIIYVSNNSARVFDALSVHPFAFVRKSYFIKDMTKAVESYCKVYGDDDSATKLVAATQNGSVSIPLRDIAYIEGVGKTQSAHLVGKEESVTLRTKMESLEKELGPKGFIRVHKGYILNMIHIRSIERDSVVMTDGTDVPMSRRRKPEIMERYLRYFRDNGSLLF